MFGLETFHIVFIAVLVAVALIIRFFMNRAMNNARKNGIVDNGLGFENEGSNIHRVDYVSNAPGEIGYQDGHRHSFNRD